MVAIFKVILKAILMLNLPLLVVLQTKFNNLANLVVVCNRCQAMLIMEKVVFKMCQAMFLPLIILWTLLALFLNKLFFQAEFQDSLKSNLIWASIFQLPRCPLSCSGSLVANSFLRLRLCKQRSTIKRPFSSLQRRSSLLLHSQLGSTALLCKLISAISLKVLSKLIKFFLGSSLKFYSITLLTPSSKVVLQFFFRKSCSMKLLLLPKSMMVLLNPWRLMMMMMMNLCMWKAWMTMKFFSSPVQMIQTQLLLISSRPLAYQNVDG